MSECLAKIEAQQAKLTENSAPWVVGEQLKDICTDSYCAELVSADLDNADMSLQTARKRSRLTRISISKAALRMYPRRLPRALSVSFTVCPPPVKSIATRS